MLFSLLLCVTHGAETAQALSPTIQADSSVLRCLQSWWNALEAFKDKHFADAVAPLLAHVQTPPYAPPVVALLGYLINNNHLALEQLPSEIQLLLQDTRIGPWGDALVKSFEYFWLYRAETRKREKKAALANLMGQTNAVPWAHVLVGLCHPEGSAERTKSFENAFAAGDLWCMCYATPQDPTSVFAERIPAVKVIARVATTLGTVERRLSILKNGTIEAGVYAQMANFYGCFGESRSSQIIEQIYQALNGSAVYQAVLAKKSEQVGEALATHFAQLCLVNPQATAGQKFSCHTELFHIHKCNQNYTLASTHCWQAYLLARTLNRPDFIFAVFADLLDLINHDRYHNKNALEIVTAALNFCQEKPCIFTNEGNIVIFYNRLMDACLQKQETHQALIKALLCWGAPASYDHLLRLVCAYPNLAENPAIVVESYYSHSTQSAVMKIFYANYLFRKDFAKAAALIQEIQEQDLTATNKITASQLACYHHIMATHFSLAGNLAQTQKHMTLSTTIRESLIESNKEEKRSGWLNECGVMTQACGDIETALKYYQSACALTPDPQKDQVVYYYNYGNALCICAWKRFLAGDLTYLRMNKQASEILRKAADMGDLDALLGWANLQLREKKTSAELRGMLQEMDGQKWNEESRGILAYIKARILLKLGDKGWFTSLRNAMRLGNAEAYTFAALMQTDQSSLKMLLELAKEFGCLTAAFLLTKIRIYDGYLPPNIYQKFVPSYRQNNEYPKDSTAKPAPEKKEKKNRSYWQKFYKMGCTLKKDAKGSRVRIACADRHGNRMTYVVHIPHGHNLNNGGKSRKAGLKRFRKKVQSKGLR